MHLTYGQQAALAFLWNWERAERSEGRVRGEANRLLFSHTLAYMEAAGTPSVPVGRLCEAFMPLGSSEEDRAHVVERLVEASPLELDDSGLLVVRPEVVEECREWVAENIGRWVDKAGIVRVPGLPVRRHFYLRSPLTHSGPYEGQEQVGARRRGSGARLGGIFGTTPAEAAKLAGLVPVEAHEAIGITSRSQLALFIASLPVRHANELDVLSGLAGSWQRWEGAMLVGGDVVERAYWLRERMEVLGERGINPDGLFVVRYENEHWIGNLTPLGLAAFRGFWTARSA